MVSLSLLLLRKKFVLDSLGKSEFIVFAQDIVIAYEVLFKDRVYLSVSKVLNSFLKENILVILIFNLENLLILDQIRCFLKINSLKKFLRV